MSRVGRLSVAIFCLFPATQSLAENFSVRPESSAGTIRVTLENVTVDQVLEDFGKKYGFQVVGLENLETAHPISATMTGSLQDILARLLRNRNHMIIRSPDNENAIVAIKILNNAYGAAPAKGAGANAGNKTAQQTKTKKTGF